MQHPQQEIKSILELLYKKYHKYKFVKPDPLQFLKKYKDPKDQEIVGLISSSFALGRVTSIINIVDQILSKLEKPRECIESLSKNELKKLFQGFVYRFFKTDQLVDFLIGIKTCIKEYDSLNNCFIHFYSNNSLQFALENFVRIINPKESGQKHILPNPQRGSACKKLHIFLRWMVRKDNIDPGTWKGVDKSNLIIPLDTHIHQLSQILGFTQSKNSSIKTAIEITNILKLYDNKDPVRFDFSLSRLGIHPNLNYKELYRYIDETI